MTFLHYLQYFPHTKVLAMPSDVRRVCFGPLSTLPMLCSTVLVTSKTTELILTLY